jgi:hypothetical protein
MKEMSEVTIDLDMVKDYSNTRNASFLLGSSRNGVKTRLAKEIAGIFLQLPMKY